MQRQLQQVLRAQPTSDGAGVSILRTLGQNRFARLDPFLMLDEFGSDDPAGYIAGFPSHPHRGFETVTYMLEGHMLHEDHLGNRGDLGPGDVQWMTAGRGIIHSEMPQQDAGRMRGFQLWLNLPAAEKMKPAFYQDLAAATIPTVDLPDGGRVKLIAGRLHHNGHIIKGTVRGISTDPTYFDVHLNQSPEVQHEAFSHQLNPAHHACIYVYEGELTVGEEQRHLQRGQLGILHAGDSLNVQARKPNTRFLLLAAQPIGEPVVQYGPFVMNTSEEIEQAIFDFQRGELT